MGSFEFCYTQIGIGIKATVNILPLAVLSTYCGSPQAPGGIDPNFMAGEQSFGLSYQYTFNGVTGQKLSADDLEHNQAMRSETLRGGAASFCNDGMPNALLTSKQLSESIGKFKEIINNKEKRRILQENGIFFIEELPVEIDSLKISGFLQSIGNISKGSEILIDYGYLHPIKFSPSYQYDISAHRGSVNSLIQHVKRKKASDLATSGEKTLPADNSKKHEIMRHNLWFHHLRFLSITPVALTTHLIDLFNSRRINDARKLLNIVEVFHSKHDIECKKNSNCLSHQFMGLILRSIKMDFKHNRQPKTYSNYVRKLSGTNDDSLMSRIFMMSDLLSFYDSNCEKITLSSVHKLTSAQVDLLEPYLHDFSRHIDSIKKCIGERLPKPYSETSKALLSAADELIENSSRLITRWAQTTSDTSCYEVEIASPKENKQGLMLAPTHVAVALLAVVILLLPFLGELLRQTHVDNSEGFKPR